MNLMFSSKSDEWETPQDLFDELMQMLDSDPYSLLKSPPRLIKVD